MNTGTAPDCYRRVSDLAASLENPRDRARLELWRDHWWAEISMDLDGAMATLSPDPKYRMYGAALASGIEVDTLDGARALYAQYISNGVCPAGPFTEERFAFADWGLVAEMVSSVFVPGAVVAGVLPDLQPDQHYEVCCRVVTIHPFDPISDRMAGEIVYQDAPFEVIPIDEASVRARLGWS